MATQQLTLKQARFVIAYVGKANGNATEAARIAGYSRPQDLGPRLVKKSQVSAAISQRLDGVSLSANEILARLTDQATATLGDFITEHGNAFRIDVAKVRKSHCVKKIKQGKYGVEIELYDAQAALDKLGKYRGLFNDSQPPPIPAPLQVTIRRNNDANRKPGRPES